MLSAVFRLQALMNFSTDCFQMPSGIINQDPRLGRLVLRLMYIEHNISNYLIRENLFTSIHYEVVDIRIHLIL